MNPRPLPVTVIGCLLIVTGAIGLAYHLTEFQAQPFPTELVWISLVRLIAVVCGVYLLRGSNWARWLALAWIAFHVVVSAFHSWFQAAAHALICAAFAYFLFRPGATRYFRK